MAYRHAYSIAVPAFALMIPWGRATTRTVGVQYAAHGYRARLAKHGILCLMSRKGDCWDNAPMESFDATLKVTAHPTLVIGSLGRLAASTKRMVSNTEAWFAFAVLTTARKAA
jgi:transposase InsO family protein